MSAILAFFDSSNKWFHAPFHVMLILIVYLYDCGVCSDIVCSPKTPSPYC